MTSEASLHIDLTADASLAAALAAARLHLNTRGNVAVVGPALRFLRTKTGAEAQLALSQQRINLSPTNRRGSITLPPNVRPQVDDVAAHLLGTNARRSPGDSQPYRWSNRAVVLAALLMYGLECASHPTPTRDRPAARIGQHH